MMSSHLKFVLSTLEQKQTYLKTVPLDADVMCTAYFLKEGKNLCFLEAYITMDGSDEILVKASQTALFSPLVRGKPNAKV